MTLLETMFGGLILAAIIYFGLKLAGVTNYWRGVISGLIPTMAYIAYSMVDWRGAEVVSMHVAVYVATATVLTLLGSRKADDNKPLHWIPKVITGFFVVLFVIMANLMYISTRGIPSSVAKWMLPRAENVEVHTAFPGVVAHEEDAAAAVNQHLKQLERQRKLGWQVELIGLRDLKPNQESLLKVRIRDRQQLPLDGAKISVSLLRPATAKEDHKGIVMAAVGGGEYQAPLMLPQPGLWVAVVDVVQGQDAYQVQENIVLPKIEPKAGS